MNELLEQFLSEAREALEGIADKLMALESAPDDAELMTHLFRLVHTLKGNSGLFEFPEMTRVLHAGEDLMDAVRHERVHYSQALADRLLDAMDFVGMLCDDIEAGKTGASEHADDAVRLAQALRALIHTDVTRQAPEPAGTPQPAESVVTVAPLSSAPLLTPERLARWPEALRRQVFDQLMARQAVWVVVYQPDEQCFFQGDDPLHRALQTPGLLWGTVQPRQSWPALAELDAYNCQLNLELVCQTSTAELEEHYRYVPDQRQIEAVSPWLLVQPMGTPGGAAVDEDFVDDALAQLDAGDLNGLERSVAALLDLTAADLWVASALRWIRLLLACTPVEVRAVRALIRSLTTQTALDWTACLAEPAPGHVPSEAATQSKVEPADQPLAASPTGVTLEALTNLLATQREVLSLGDDAQWLSGRIKAAARVLGGCLRATRREAEQPQLDAAVAQALALRQAEPLARWLTHAYPEGGHLMQPALAMPAEAPGLAEPQPVTVQAAATVVAAAPALAVEVDAGDDGADTLLMDPPLPPSAGGGAGGDAEQRFGRRQEDAPASARSLKVDQTKIDRLMNLIGEMVVAKNAIPYLANRAETVFGVRELSREIKAQYAVINRISEEMQDAIMQVRMMPVSFIFQRFPRLVRDTSRRLGKDVNLVLEGQDTAADKNIIESLGDPLVHIVRNSLDHGLELPEVRKAVGKPAVGTLKIVARQESDRVVIEISDDGKGIDPEVIKRKAYEKGVIDEALLDRISDQEAINLIFAPGFSTAEVVSDLSGRGVGMDVVRTAVERVNGNITLDSVKGQGTRIRLSLPLSMAVTNVMTIEADEQVFGVPMDGVVETVRVPCQQVRQIKQSMVTTLRGRIVPLRSLNSLLGLAAPPLTNESNEYAVLVVRVGDEILGLLVDNFRETADIILKPLAGVLGQMKCYAGSALMGDGSVLMVLNLKEML